MRGGAGENHGEAGVLHGRGHHRQRRRQGRGGRHPHFRRRGRHRGRAVKLCTSRGSALGNRLGRSPSGAVPQPPAPESDVGNGRQAHDRPRCGGGPAIRRGGIRLCHRAAHHHGLPHDARVPFGHLPLRHRHPESRAAQALRGQAGIRRKVHAVHRRAIAGNHGEARRADGERAGGPGRFAENEAGRRP